MWLDDLKREIADIESKAQWDNAESLDAWHSELHVNNMRGRRAVDDGMRSSAIKTKEKRVRKPKALSASSSAISNTPSKGRRRIREATPISVSTTKWMNMHEPGSEALHNKVPTVNILEDVDQDDFNQLMRKHIMNDKNLWQRILRYEPVDFMEFFDIAVAVGVPRNFVTHRLRAFLTSKVRFRGWPPQITHTLLCRRYKFPRQKLGNISRHYYLSIHRLAWLLYVGRDHLHFKHNHGAAV